MGESGRLYCMRTQQRYRTNGLPREVLAFSLTNNVIVLWYIGICFHSE